MAQDRTDDTGRFMNAIAAFSAAPEEVTIYGRRIGARDTSIVDAILSEINETVLRRVLHFSTPDGLGLSLDVSERRVYRLRSLPRDLEQRYNHLLRRNLTEQDASEFLEIADALSEDSSCLYVKASLPDKPDALGFDALSIRVLLSARENASKLSNLPAQITNAISEGQGRELAIYVRTGDAGLTRLGEAVYWDSLGQISNTFDAEGFTKPFIRLWQGALVKDCGLLLAALDGHLIAMLVPQDQIMEQFALWRHVVFEAT